MKLGSPGESRSLCQQRSPWRSRWDSPPGPYSLSTCWFAGDALTLLASGFKVTGQDRQSAGTGSCCSGSAQRGPSCKCPGPARLWGRRRERGPRLAPSSPKPLPHRQLTPGTRLLLGLVLRADSCSGWSRGAGGGGAWSDLVCWQEPFSHHRTQARPSGPVVPAPEPVAPLRLPCLRFTNIRKT